MANLEVIAQVDLLDEIRITLVMKDFKWDHFYKELLNIFAGPLGWKI